MALNPLQAKPAEPGVGAQPQDNQEEEHCSPFAILGQGTEQDNGDERDEDTGNNSGQSAKQFLQAQEKPGPGNEE